MNHPRNLLIAALLLVSTAAHAGNATWKLDPTNGEWNTADNWRPNTVPNGTDDIATFGVSNVTEITQSMSTTLGGVQFAPGASSYSINVLAGNTFSLNAAGVTNGSGVTQSFNCSTSAVDFYATSTAGDNVIYTNATTDGFVSSHITFHDNATAGTATFINHGMAPYGQGGVVFRDSAAAGSSQITVNGVFGFGQLGAVFFYDQSTAANSAILYDMGAFGIFYSQATAASSTLTCSGNSSVYFAENSTAGAAVITCLDVSNVYFLNSATAGAAVITTATGSVTFSDFSTAGAATITTDGSTLNFQEQSDGGTARIVLTNESTLFADHERRGPVLRLGSLEGNGTATINRLFVIGGNNLDATFSGSLSSTSEGDWLTKVGTGTWTLAGTGSYPGSTTVTAGALVVTGASTPTGTGPVKVNAGTLGGSGTIAGPVTIGTGSGAGAFLAPAHGGKKQLTLTIQGSVTFNADATYTYTFKAKGNKSKIDKVIANGVTINGGAKVNLSGTTQGQLTQGTTLTLIKNAAATPVSGTFSNLPEGGIVNVNGNNLQASYEGGDGNDLTLTTVP